MPEENKPPDVSPTGTPVIPAAAVKYIIPVVAVAGALALAPTAGVDVSFIPPIVLKWCALIAFLGNVLALAGPGVRR